MELSNSETAEWRRPGTGEAGNGELLFSEYKVSVLQDEEFCGWMVVTEA